MNEPEAWATMKVPVWFNDWITEHTRDDETNFVAMRRVMGGPEPETAAGIISEESAMSMREAIERKRGADVDGKTDLRENVQ